MNELIKVNYENEKPTVLARELYEFLGYDKSQWSRWYKKNIQEDEYFVNGIDYIPLDIVSNGNPTRDFQVTVDMGKELSMLARTEKGKQARQYFVELEKAWNTPEAVMARALKMADTKIKNLENQIEEQKPLILFAETVTKSCDNILMRDMAKLLCDQKLSIGEKRLYKLLRNNNVLMSDNSPYQSFVDRGYFVVKESTFETPYGTKTNTTTLVTPKGQIWIVGKVKEWLGDINECR